MQTMGHFKDGEGNIIEDNSDIFSLI